MRGLVHFVDAPAGFGFVRTSLRGDVKMTISNHVIRRADGTYAREPIGHDIGVDDLVDVPIQIAINGDYHAPCWIWLKAAGTFALDELDGLQQGKLKFYNEQKEHGFIYAPSGAELWAHGTNYREVTPGRGLKRLGRGEPGRIRDGTPVTFLRGTSPRGGDSASLWFVTPK